MSKHFFLKMKVMKRLEEVVEIVRPAKLAEDGKTVLEPATCIYRDGQSDQSIAVEMGTTVNVVRDLRRNGFGQIGRGVEAPDARIVELERRADTQAATITDILRRVAELEGAAAGA